MVMSENKYRHDNFSYSRQSPFCVPDKVAMSKEPRVNEMKISKLGKTTPMKLN